jgi:hypothetical protein
MSIEEYGKAERRNESLTTIEYMANNIFFQPFVGKDYADGGIFGKRIMVLGESHYCDDGCADCGDCRLHRECMGFTQGVLRDYLDDGTEQQNGDDIVVDGYHVATGWYVLSNGKRVKAMAVNHPSVGYSWDYWYKVIKGFYSL